MGMRTLALLLMAFSLAGAEQFTLADGRVLTGTYDEATGTLNISMGKGVAALHVDPKDIKKRQPSHEAEDAAALAKERLVKQAGDRAAFWQDRGYHFDPAVMTASEMDAAVQAKLDAEEAREQAAAAEEKAEKAASIKKAQEAAAAALKERQARYLAMATPDPSWRKVELSEFPECLRGAWWRLLPGGTVISEDREVGRSTISPLRAPHYIAKNITAYYSGDTLKMVSYARVDSMPLSFTDVISDGGRVDEIWTFGKNVNCDTFFIK